MKLLSQMSPNQLVGKRVLLRVDFNVPLKNGKVSDDTRIRHTLPTLNFLLKNGASVALCSHLGRPAGKPSLKYSLKPVAEHLAILLGRPVSFFPNPLENKRMKLGDVLLLQNTRFFDEETENNTMFAAALARGCDLFVNDAFGTAHRAHASTAGVAGLLPHAAGLLFEKEVKVLSQVLEHPKTPLVLLVGGAKMKTKIGVLRYFSGVAETILLGGGIANTFLAASGKTVGESLFEPTEIYTAQGILQKAKESGCRILMPADATLSSEVSETATIEIASTNDLTNESKILDLGPKAIREYVEIIEKAGTFLWNGPVGIFELSPFSAGTRAIANAASKAKKSILGGGDTLEAIRNFDLSEKNFFHCSTGGGAMLKFLEGDTLPAIEYLS